MRQKFMHSEIFTDAQTKLLPIIAKFRDGFGLVGGTAIALHIGHRESIDFDMFSPDEFTNARIRQVFARAGKPISAVFTNETGQFTFVVDSVQVTFYQFQYPIEYAESYDSFARMPTLLTLAAMKAFALGQRSKWKDYVDLYFILRDHYSLDEISDHARSVFKGEFNAKLLRQQLDYFDDIDYREPVVFKPGFEVAEDEIKSALKEYSLS